MSDCNLKSIDGYLLEASQGVDSIECFDIHELVCVNRSSLTIDSSAVPAEDNRSEDASLMGDLYDQYKFALAHPEASFSGTGWDAVCKGQETIKVTQGIEISDVGEGESSKYGDLLNLGEQNLDVAFGLLGRDLFPDVNLDRAPEVLRLFAKQGEMEIDKSFASVLPPVLSQREHHELTGDSPFSAPRCVGGDQG